MPRTSRRAPAPTVVTDEGTSAGAATPADARVAEALPTGPRTPVRRVTSAFVELLANPSLQRALLAAEPELKRYRDGSKLTSIAAALKLVREGVALTGVSDRLENSALRVNARIVQINAALGPFETALAHIAAQAGEDTDVGRALAALAARRTEARGVNRAVRTRARLARSKAKTGPTG